MVPIPPPPEHEPAAIPPPPPPSPEQVGAFPRPGELTLGWRWVLAVGWTAVLVGLIAVADAARTIHKPPFWTDPAWLLAVPMALPAVAAVGALLNEKRAVWTGAAAVVVLAVCAVVDRTTTPGVAAALGVLALIGALVTLASLAGRMPRPIPGPR